MARIRNIKPDFFTSEDIGALTVHSRLLYVALWTMADIEGKMKYQPTALAAQCMPFEMEKFEDCLSELIKNKHVLFYESGGKKYLLIPKFTEHQRPHHSEKPKGYPDPTPINNGLNTVNAPRKDAREGKKGGEGEEGRGRGNKSTNDDAITIANHLLSRIKHHKPNFKSPSQKSFDSWISEIDKSIRLDKRTTKELFGCIEWIYTTKEGEFWIPNILSGKKLRDQFDQMESKMMLSREYKSLQAIQNWYPVDPFTGKPYLKGDCHANAKAV